MAAGSRDRPPMLAPGRYPQWRSRFLRYVDTRPNRQALRKCILSGPYKPTTVLVLVVEATDNSPAVADHTTLETPANMSPENKAHFLAEKEAIHLILTGYGDDIYSTVDACQTAHEIWEAIEMLQQGERIPRGALASVLPIYIALIELLELQIPLRFAIEDLAFWARRILCFAQEESCVLLKKNLAFCSKDTAFCLRQDPAFCLRRLPNGEALRKYILSGPYKPSTVLVHAVEATDNSPAVAENTTLETPANMSPENKAHFLAEKEAIHLILTGIGDDIYSTIDACQTAQEMWEAIERLQQGQRLISLTTSAGMVKYQNEVNELSAEKLARNANPLALVTTAQSSQDSYYQTPRSHRSSAPSPKPSMPSRSHTSTKHKGKEIAKPITPPSETASEEDSDPEQAQRDKDMQKNLALIAKYFKKIYKPTNNNLRTSSNSKNKNVDMTPWYKNDDHSGQFGTQRTVNVAGTREKVGSQEKMLLCKQAEQGVPLQAEQYDWLADTDEEVDEQELEAHYSYMAKIQEVPTANLNTDSEPLEQVQTDARYNGFANDLQHSEQSKSVSNTCLVKTDNSNVTPDSPDMCEDDIQNDQNYVASDDERVMLANLIANLKLDVDENKKIQKQLKKANTTLAQELTECKVVLTETSKSLGESISVRDSCLVSIQTKQTEFEKLIPDGEETLALERESRSKLNKDKVCPYDYTKLNSLYEIFKPPTQEYETQLAHTNETRRKIWRKSFVKSKPNICKNVDFLPVSKSISKSRQAYNVMTNNINHFKRICDDAWTKHSKDLFRAPTALDLELLIQTCLMPLAIKTESDSLKFVHELKQEMHTDLKYVESLEKEIDELESKKAEFLDMYDEILQDCVSKDVKCSYLQSLFDLDALSELQCMYLHKVKECDCVARKLSNQTESVSKEVHSELLKCFAKVEKHSISFEIDLQKRKEQVKNDTTWNEKASNVFRKEREQYIKIQDLKAKLQDKNIVISELKKLIEKGNGKYIDTKFDKPSVVRQINAQRIPKPSVLGKPALFLDSLERKYFPKTRLVSKANVSEGLSKPVTAQTSPQTARKAVGNTNVLKPGMYRIDNRTTHTRAPQLTQTVRNTNPRVSTSTGVNHKPNVSRPQLKSNQSRDKVLQNNSQVKVKKTQVEVQPRISSVSNKMKSVTACNDSLKSRTLNATAVCATCNKCLVDSNHFACVTKQLHDVHARTKKPNIVQLILFVVDYGCMKHMTGNLKLLCNFVEKFLGTVRFGNDQFAPILGYGDLVQGNVTINRVYYVEGLNHNLFSVGQFCDADLEVAFRKSTCFVRDLQGNDLLIRNRGSDLYTISLQESTSLTPLCVMAKATPTQAWLWHRTLSHLNFDYINLLSKKDIMIGLPKLKYDKDQLCSSCELSKAKRSSFKLKAVPSSKGRLNLLHMDLCGPMQVASINGKKYILVIVDDYSRYTWTLFLRSKDEILEVLKDFLTMIQRNLQALVINVRTDRGTEFLNKTLNAFFKEEGIEHQTSIA
nr:retrovirus-related Pol polyprotein from transposon TNT 1-94 [Tanacetum cinerariifolium]